MQKPKSFKMHCLACSCESTALHVNARHDDIVLVQQNQTQAQVQPQQQHQPKQTGLLGEATCTTLQQSQPHMPQKELQLKQTAATPTLSAACAAKQVPAQGPNGCSASSRIEKGATPPLQQPPTPLPRAMPRRKILRSARSLQTPAGGLVCRPAPLPHCGLTVRHYQSAPRPLLPPRLAVLPPPVWLQPIVTDPRRGPRPPPRPPPPSLPPPSRSYQALTSPAVPAAAAPARQLHTGVPFSAGCGSAHPQLPAGAAVAAPTAAAPLQRQLPVPPLPAAPPWAQHTGTAAPAASPVWRTLTGWDSVQPGGDQQLDMLRTAASVVCSAPPQPRPMHRLCTADGIPASGSKCGGALLETAPQLSCGPQQQGVQGDRIQEPLLHAARLSQLESLPLPQHPPLPLQAQQEVAASGSVEQPRSRVKFSLWMRFRV